MRTGPSARFSSLTTASVTSIVKPAARSDAYMSLDRVRESLEDNGYPRHIVEGGRDGLIRRWREFVAEVEKGYTRGLEDYRNDLDLRMIIQMAAPDDAEIRALDARLQKMLRPLKKRLWESGP